MDAPKDPLEGRQVAGYRLERVVGAGDWSVVYRAADLRMGRTVALKLIAPGHALDDALRRRLTNELQVAAAIEHPHILPVFEVNEAEGVLYIAMQYIPGPDLRTLLDEEGPLPVPTALRIAAQVASALDAAHWHGLVHRDVKPSNILIAPGNADEPEHVYLTGFGLTHTSLTQNGFTVAEQFTGTLDYVAPELVSGRPVDGRSDLYSLACVVYESLVGRPPFERAGDLRALLWAHQYDPPPPLSKTRPGIEDGADVVMAKALAKTPDERYDSCRRFVDALRSAMRPSDPDRPPPTPAPSWLQDQPPPAHGYPSGPPDASTPPGPPFGDDDDEW
ncbi:serine/threonine-protein kinase [Streptomyces crystallinus]|uniref:non-specific serine/threonine protein kinase n=1 Tax=Streptomyces crystallinus TaxID=68191 RepID=A0ABP3RJR2_9ACTN